eukprot:IDg6323t1
MILSAIPKRFLPALTTRMLGDSFISFSVPGGSAFRAMQLGPAPVSKTIVRRLIRVSVYLISACTL